VISLALSFDADGPQPARSDGGGRHNPIHTMLVDGSREPTAPGGFQYTDDAITMPLQCATQWDSLAHVAYDGKLYNDRDVALVTADGAQVNSIDRMRDGVVGRGVLLDLPHHLDVPWLDGGTPVLPADLDACAEASGVTIESGDVLLVRTGHMKRFRDAGTWEGYIGPDTAGLSVHCARWLFERQVAAVASDNWGVEVLPFETEECVMPLHMIAIRDMGLLLGEMFDLERLSDACAEDGRYQFLFAGTPLPITGAVGSPVNPVAVK
jgi:kynurenine formamidase